MATAPFDISTTTPADNDIVSQFPANERTNRDVTESWLLIEHNTSGTHKLVTLDDVTTPTVAAGKVGIWNAAGVLYQRLGAGSVRTFDAIPAGTKMVFVQAAVPVGWTLYEALTDRVLRVLNTVGGASGGGWTITGLTGTNEVINGANLPLISTPTSSQTGTVSGTAVNGVGGNIWYGAPTTVGTGSPAPINVAIAQNGSWRPAYVDVVIGTRA